jgi:ABC-type transporter Mla subunit MlaD
MIEDVESPSLVETMIRLPGALLRLPSSTLAALDALNDLSERLDRLTTMLERIEGGMNMAGSGIDLAALGIANALSGLKQVVGASDRQLPALSDSAAAQHSVTEWLSSVAVQLATELPKASKSLQDASPELSVVVGSLDERFTHLDDILTALARLVEAVIDAIPGMRRVIRVAVSPIEPL